MGRRVLLLTVSFLVGILFSQGSPVFAQVTYVENFNDPLGGWTTRWFYQNTNAENYYVAGGNCDPNYRGNEPNGLWISDDRGCGNFVSQDPVRINFLNNFGDNATEFSIAVGVCLQTTLSIYDRNGALVTTDSLPQNCYVLVNHSYTLSNGISAFEFNSGGGSEGNTAIDDVIITIGGRISAEAIPTFTRWGMIILVLLIGFSSAYCLRRRKLTSG